jgi:hypothetical protein
MNGATVLKGPYEALDGRGVAWGREAAKGVMALCKSAHGTTNLIFDRWILP